MADIDLATALNMFKDGVNSLALTNAIGQANDQVSQIRANTSDQQQQRSQMQQVSNNLVAHMATFGTPATTMQAVGAAIGPKQYKDANAMNMDAQLTGNKQLADQASDQQDFENDKAFEIAKIKAGRPTNPMQAQAANEKQQEFNLRQLKTYGDDLDSSKASSRSSFGKWQQVNDQGTRMNAILGDPNTPKTPQELQLAADALGTMVKGSAMTKEDGEALHAASAKISAAMLVQKATNAPVKVDLSDFSNLYKNIGQREDENAKGQLVDDLMQKINSRQSLASRGGETADQFKLTTAAALNRQGVLGGNVSPNDVSVDSKNGVQIKGVTDVMGAANQAAKHVKAALADANGPDSVARANGIKFLNSFGLSPNTDPKSAADTVKRKIKANIFSQ